jgi:hypothetical protein
MYGDTEALGALAQRMRRLGEELRAEADAVLRASLAVLWVGAAGSALREAVRVEARALQRCAGLFDGAARALERHAAEVAERQALIASLERASALLPGLRPPSGHRDWLAFVPGLS